MRVSTSLLAALSLSMSLAGLLVAAPAGAGQIISSVDAETLGPKKRTVLGLHLTAAEAGRALAEDPGIVFIDIRDPIEVSFIGHAAPVDALVPWRIGSHVFVPEKGRYRMAPNAAFVSEVEGVLAREGKGKDDPVFLICRSGNRTGAAANALAKAGFTNVWNLVDGFEGDKGPDGIRAVNGWRNAGLPWRYELDARTAWQPPAQ
ncbi:MAG: rhodanese-like domain-containing protein [Pseudomonadota bacterium]